MKNFTITGPFIGGVYQILPNIFKDFRGEFVETYNYKDLSKFGKFIQDDFSMSHKNVLRGIHGDAKTAKLVHCINGRIINFVVNLNKKSTQYLKWLYVDLTPDTHNLMYIPKGFGNLTLSLEDNSIYVYKQTTIYGESPQFTIDFNDKTLNIPWQTWISPEDLIISNRDIFESITIKEYNKGEK